MASLDGFSQSGIIWLSRGAWNLCGCSEVPRRIVSGAVFLCRSGTVAKNATTGERVPFWNTFGCPSKMEVVSVLGQKCHFPDVGKMVGPRVLRDAVRVQWAVTVPAGIVQVEARSLYKVYTKVIQGFITLLPGELGLCYLGSSGFVIWEARPNIWGAGTVTAGTGTVGGAKWYISRKERKGRKGARCQIFFDKCSGEGCKML